MFNDTAIELRDAALDFLIRLGEIAVVAVIYFGFAYLIIRVVVKRLKESPILSRYGKEGSMIAFRIISIAVYLVAIVGVLSFMGVNTNGILTLMSAFTVAIGLALQDVMRNLISGLFMLAERPFSVGDRVTVRANVGTVQGIDIRTTMLRTDEGSLLMVPNQVMFTEILQNNSRYNMRMIRYHITTNKPPEELMRILEEMAESIESVRPPLDAPILIQHEEENSQWEVSFAVNARQMRNEYEIGEAIIRVIPDATIARVTD